MLDRVFGSSKATKTVRTRSIRVRLGAEAMQRLMVGETISYTLPGSAIEVTFTGK